MTRFARFAIPAALVAMMGFSGSARADVKWTLSDVAFSDGATLTGWFNTGTSGNLTTFDITLTGSAVGSAEFTPSNSTGYVFGDNFFEIALPDATSDTAHFQFQADVPFTGLTTITLNGSTNLYDGIGHFGVTSGTVSDVPEPVSLALLGVGVSALAFRGRRASRR